MPPPGFVLLGNMAPPPRTPHGDRSFMERAPSAAPTLSGTTTSETVGSHHLGDGPRRSRALAAGLASLGIAPAIELD